MTATDEYPAKAAAIRAFYSERVPEQFNATLARQRALAQQDAAAARTLEEMEAVRASIVVMVDDSSETGSADARLLFAFDIERGEMSAAREGTYPPFLILGHDGVDFDAIRRECGESLLGFLGSLAGLGDEMLLTSKRVRSLRELAGGLLFERTGKDGFALFAHFGVEAPALEPRATIRLDERVHRRLQRGELDPQDAFLAGEIEVEGDEGMAIGLALTAISPD